MKSKVNFTAMYLLIAIFLICSCRKDDCPVIEEPVIEENPDNPDGLETGDDLIGYINYSTVIEKGTSLV